MKERILFIDIENSPLISYTWGIWEQNVIKKIQDSFILCVAYKWLGDKDVQVVAQRDFPNYKKDRANDREVLLKVWELLNEADIVIAHNGKAFDLKKINSRFLVHKINPPSPYRVIDTLTIARSKFKFDSNKLDALGETLDLGRKIEHEGFKLWEDCMAGNKKAWKKMIAYNKQDVALLEDLYLEFRPWISNHPNLNIINNRLSHCPTCQSSKLVSHGYSFSQSAKKRRYQCNDCGSWSHGENEKTLTIK